MSFSPLIQQLINSLRCLPGVGPKSAQRMAFHLLERDKEGALSLAAALEKSRFRDRSIVVNAVRFRRQPICDICQSRDS